MPLSTQKQKTITLLITAEIKGFFPKHTIPCIQKFILLLECILQSRTVCLYKCRDKASQLNKGKKTNPHNSYVGLIRFFNMKRITDFISGIRSMMMAITATDLQYLIVDRTNWKRGKKNFNLLTIGNYLNNIFIPLH